MTVGVSKTSGSTAGSRKAGIHQPSAADRASASAVAVIYARYSSHNQREESIEEQVKECRAYAKRNNLFVAEVYADKAVSGRTDRRRDFQRMMRDAEKGYFSVVIAYKSNRIGRNMLQALTNEDKLGKYGVRVLYAKEEFGDTAAGRFALRTMMNVNQFYSENMSEDILRGLRDNAEKGLVTGAMPFGYTVGADHRYAINEAQATVVREIFMRYLDGCSLADIAADLNRRGIKTRRGGDWNKGSFHRLLANERYCGVYIYKDIRVEGGIPAIISRDTWLMAQEKLNSTKTTVRHSADYLLTGKLFCGECGSPMVGVSGYGKSGTPHYYYACQAHRLKKTCNKKAALRDVTEDSVIRYIVSYILRPDVILWMADQVMDYQKQHSGDGMLNMYLSRKAKVDASIKNILDAIEQGVFTASTKGRLEELEKEQKKLQDSIAVERASQPAHTRERIIYWLEQFTKGNVDDPAYRETLIRIFVNAVYLYDDGGMKIAFNFSPNNDPVDLAFINSSPGSYTVDLAPPNTTNTNTATLSFAAQVFVLVLKNEASAF